MIPSAIRTLLTGWMVLSAAACTKDPCADALSNARIGDGPASIKATVSTRAGTRGHEGSRLECVNVSVVRADNYADTLAHVSVHVHDGTVALSGLPAANVDVIVDRPGFFPVKLSNQTLRAGPNPLVDRMLLYSAREATTIPGAFGFVLKDGAAIDQVSHVYRVIEGARVFPEPGRSYQIEIPVKDGIKRARNRVERLCRQLVWSPHVDNARPLVNLTAVYPGV